MSNKIVVGQATHTHDSTKKGLYGKKRSGKNNLNGGFSGEPTVSYTNISQDKWDAIFPNGYKGPQFKNEK